ncbi:iron-sulfur cluster carrier protein ApbC [Neptuniibacter sp. CAU 1671]|uniref:iron-sulfur cluster carrier protein ApbC n=1 Tax=Neptuniibacter sp. CAU 1671 TaxID=3032593 RepID=UPI0023DB3C1C|nr:iron-sulfur cluster carrier protein ApbC [Neptuniibacter sp. CAU 1671]MDF2181091.1 iron-sulfur cluster carrier protein ApbC [Neptuniibacter sp. CAU 1671]
MSTLQHQIDSLLASFPEPMLQQPLASAGVVRLAQESGGNIRVEIALPYPCRSVVDQLKTELETALLGLEGADSAEVLIEQEISAGHGQHQLPAMQGVKNIIAVASGKGGVGKSTTAVNLALAMAAEGARVGILDADIYGPSQGKMLGVPAGTKPDTHDEKHFLPVEALGLQSMSMAYLIDENTPMVWRGPMVSGALQQLLTQTFWQDLDYLFIDMPPGTGDVQLTLSQKVPVSGAVIVTTPQDIALLDAKKGIEMFRKVDIPVLGVVENMSVHVCSNCGHAETIFGSGGGDRIATEYETQLLGQLPLALTIREQADSGLPTVAADADSTYARIYREVALKLAVTLAGLNQSADEMPLILVEED